MSMATVTKSGSFASAACLSGKNNQSRPCRSLEMNRGRRVLGAAETLLNGNSENMNQRDNLPRTLEGEREDVKAENASIEFGSRQEWWVTRETYHSLASEADVRTDTLGGKAYKYEREKLLFEANADGSQGVQRWV